MSAFLAVLLGVFIAVYGALILTVVRRPLLGRLALREVLRRPSQTAQGCGRRKLCAPVA